MTGSPPQACCPRCGYDLSGDMARWETACELHGVCPECGIRYRWRDVLVPERYLPRWFYESAYRSWAPTLVPTLARLLVPWLFWRELGLWAPINRRRLALLCAFLLLISHVIIATGSCVRLADAVELQAPWGTSLGKKDISIYARVAAWPYRTRFHPFIDAAGKLPQGWAMAVWIAEIAENDPARAYDGIAVRSGSGALVPMTVSVLCVVVMPLSYLLLRQTLRRTRVRLLQLVRIAAYSMVVVPVLALLHQAWLQIAESGTRSFGQDAFGVLLAPLALALIWLQLHLTLTVFLLLSALALLGFFWYWATRLYLRLPHAGSVVLSMMAVTGLLLSVVCALVRPELLCRNFPW